MRRSVYMSVVIAGIDQPERLYIDVAGRDKFTGCPVFKRIVQAFRRK